MKRLIKQKYNKKIKIKASALDFLKELITNPGLIDFFQVHAQSAIDYLQYADIGPDNNTKEFKDLWKNRDLLKTQLKDFMSKILSIKNEVPEIEKIMEKLPEVKNTIKMMKPSIPNPIFMNRSLQSSFRLLKNIKKTAEELPEEVKNSIEEINQLDVDKVNQAIIDSSNLAYNFLPNLKILQNIIQQTNDAQLQGGQQHLQEAISKVETFVQDTPAIQSEIQEIKEVQEKIDEQTN